MAKRLQTVIAALLIALSLCVLGCSASQFDNTASDDASYQQPAIEEDSSGAESESSEQPEEIAPPAPQENVYPDYDGSALYVRLNDGNPSFSTDDLASNAAWESYSPLDALGRVGVASACIGQEIMPTSERESISEVTPSGWVQNKYDFVDGGYVYNRSHLIGFQLTGENANERNLMTGTRTMNLTMLDFEARVADYIKTTGNHVLYRVTPNFVGSELVARGVQMEAMSVEDVGQGISLNVYVFNVEPGVSIDYATGNNVADGTRGSSGSSTTPAPGGSEQASDYVLNTNSKKIHQPSCSSVSKMSAKNREDVHDTLANLEARGYEPCKNCF